MSERLARSAGLAGLGTLSSRVLGLARNFTLASVFGVNDAVDAYYVAARLPALLRELFAEGAMSAAFVPTFTRYLTRDGRDAAWRLGSQVLNALLLVTGILVIAGIVFAADIVPLYAPEYAEVPGKLELTIALTRITLPFLTLVALAAVLMGMLNALRRFFVPAASPAMFNIVLIASALLSVWICPGIGVDPIYGLAVGFVLGGLGQMAAQWPTLRGEGYRHRWVLDPRDPGLREVLILMGPGAMGQAAAQINLLVNTWLATGEGTGAVTWLSYGFQLMYLPIGLFGVSVATAAIPDLAMHAARAAHAEMRATISSAMRLMLMLSVPACLGLVALAVPIVELTLEYGRFTPADTHAVAMALLFYAPGLVGYSVVKIVSPSFYALQDARTPVMISAVTVAANIVMNLTFVHWIGYLGLALGTAIAASINAGLLLWYLSRRIGGVDGGRITRAFLKILLAASLMGVAAWGAETGLRSLVPGSLPFTGWLPDVAEVMLARLVRVFAAIGVGVAVLAGASHLLRIQEFQVAMRRVAGRLRG